MLPLLPLMVGNCWVLSIHGGLVPGPPADIKLLCAQVSYIKGIGQPALCTWGSAFTGRRCHLFSLRVLRVASVHARHMPDNIVHPDQPRLLNLPFKALHSLEQANCSTLVSYYFSSHALTSSQTEPVTISYLCILFTQVWGAFLSFDDRFKCSAVYIFI